MQLRWTAMVVIERPATRVVNVYIRKPIAISRPNRRYTLGKSNDLIGDLHAGQEFMQITVSARLRDCTRAGSKIALTNWPQIKGISERHAPG